MHIKIRQTINKFLAKFYKEYTVEETPYGYFKLTHPENGKVFSLSREMDNVFGEVMVGITITKGRGTTGKIISKRSYRTSTWDVVKYPASSIKNLNDMRVATNNGDMEEALRIMRRP